AFGSLSGDFQITDVDPNNIFSFTEIDSDSDGLIDILRVNVGVTVTQQGGTYRIEGLLVNALGEPVAWSISDGQSLAVGTRTMTLDFDGKMLFDQLPVGSASESFKLVAIR